MRSLSARRPRSASSAPSLAASELRQGLPHVGRHLLCRALGRLERDVARIAFDHDDIDDALADLVAFHEAAVVDGKIVLLEPGMRLPDLLDALDLFHADVEQAHARALDAEQGARHGRAHRAQSRRAGGRWRRCWRPGRARCCCAPRSATGRRSRAARCRAWCAGPAWTSPSGRRCCRPRPRHRPRPSAPPPAQATCWSRVRGARPGSACPASRWRCRCARCASARRERDAASRCGWMRARSPTRRKLMSGCRSSARAAPGTTTAGPLIAAHGVERYRARRCHGVFALRDLLAVEPGAQRPRLPHLPPKTPDHSRSRRVTQPDFLRFAKSRSIAERRACTARHSALVLDLCQRRKGALGLAGACRCRPVPSANSKVTPGFLGNRSMALARHSKTTRPTSIRPATMGSRSGSSCTSTHAAARVRASRFPASSRR